MGTPRLRLVAGLMVAATALLRGHAADAADGSRPQLTPVVQLVDSVSVPVFSEDGRLMITHSNGAVRLWDARTRALLHALPVRDAAFGPRGAWILTNEGQILDTATWGTIGSLPIKREKGTWGAVRVSADGKTAVVITPNWNSERRPCIEVWDVASRTLRRSFDEGTDVRIGGRPEWVDLSSDGRILFGYTQSGVAPKLQQGLEVWDTTTGQRLRGLAATLPPTSLRLSRDGKTGLVTQAGSTGDYEVLVVDVDAGQVARRLSLPNAGGAAFTPDEKQIVSASREVEGQTARGVVTFWDARTGANVRSFRSAPVHLQNATDWNGGFGDATFSPEGNTLVLTSSDLGEKSLTEWTPSGTLLGSYGRVSGEAFGSDFGKAFSVMSQTAKATSASALGSRFKGGVSSDGRTVFVGKALTEGLVEWDTSALAVRRRISASQLPPAQALAMVRGLSSDGTYYGAWNLQRPKDFELHNFATGAVVGTLPGNEEDSLTNAEFTPQSKLLVSRVKLSGRNMQTVMELRSLPNLQLVDTPLTAFSIPAARMTESGDRVVFSAITVDPGPPGGANVGRFELVVYDLARRTVVKRFPRKGMALALALDRAGAHALWSEPDSVAWVDLSTGQDVWSKPGHSVNVVAAEVSPDGTYATTLDVASEVRRWRLDNGDSVGMIAESPDDWIVYSDDGYFDASRGGGALISLVRGLDAFPVEQLAVRYNRPDVLLARMGLGTPELIAHYKARYDSRLRNLGITNDDAARFGESSPSVAIDAFRVEGTTASAGLRFGAASAPLKTFQVTVNGAPVFAGRGQPVQGDAQKIEVVLTPGPNRVEAAVFDASGRESLHAFRDIDLPGTSHGDLYFLGIGVSKYRDPRLSLQYAAKDASDLAAAFATLKGRGFDNVRTQTLLDEQVTPDAIRGVKAFFATAKPQDTVVAIVAGHGTRANDAAAAYYFVTYDTDVKHVAETAAPFELVEGLFDGVSARKKLLLLDTCESGERDETDAAAAASRGARGMRSRALALAEDAAAQSIVRNAPRVLLDRERFIYRDLSRRTGAIVLASSRGYESSYELDELQNGTFTAALKTALSTKQADADEDGSVSIDELRRFVAQDVARSTGDKQHPTLDRDNPFARIAFSVVAPASVGTPGSQLGAERAYKTASPHACGCRLVASSTSVAPALLSLGAIVMAALRRRRRDNTKRGDDMSGHPHENGHRSPRR